MTGKAECISRQAGLGRGGQGRARARMSRQGKDGQSRQMKRERSPTCEGRALQCQADQQLPQLIISLHLHKLNCLYGNHTSSYNAVRTMLGNTRLLCYASSLQAWRMTYRYCLYVPACCQSPYLNAPFSSFQHNHPYLAWEPPSPPSRPPHLPPLPLFQSGFGAMCSRIV